MMTTRARLRMMLHTELDCGLEAAGLEGLDGLAGARREDGGTGLESRWE